MKIFTTAQIRDLDEYTITHEPISSIDLMERAALALFNELIVRFPEPKTLFYVFAGPGNNGGDALALSAMLFKAGYSVKVFLYFSEKLSVDCESNFQRLQNINSDILHTYRDELFKPEIPANAIIIDGLFGSGLNRPLHGYWSLLVQYINQHKNQIISIDIPSGLNGDSIHHFTEATIKAHLTLTFQFPKLAFFHPENEKYVGKWKVLDIGLHPDGITETESPFVYTDLQTVAPLLKKRPVFSHKGSFGHLGLVAGCKGMAGASILASKAALRSGVGLITLHGPETNRCILQNVAPEVIFEADKNNDCVTEFYHIDKYDALAIGPGLGTRTVTVEMMDYLLKHIRIPAVLDADALNIIAVHEHMYHLLPPGSILTPHPGEFDRLCGSSIHSVDRIEKALKLASDNRVYVVLKGAYTKIITPEGKIYINSTGNPGMATAGSGDVLTGIIGSLLAQEYEPEEAALLGVYLHGLAADLALENQSEESLMAGDIIENLGNAFKKLKDN
jgi:NAD(P)H-hydrate epimerase